MVYLSYRLYKGETKMKKLVLIFMMVIMGFGCGKDITTKEYREKIGLPFPKTSTLEINEDSIIYSIDKKEQLIKVTYTVLRDNNLTEQTALNMTDSLIENGFEYLGGRKFYYDDTFLLYGPKDIEGTDRKMIQSTLINEYTLKTLDKEYFNFLDDKITQKIGKYLLEVEKSQK